MLVELARGAKLLEEQQLAAHHLAEPPFPQHHLVGGRNAVARHGPRHRDRRVEPHDAEGPRRRGSQEDDLALEVAHDLEKAVAHAFEVAPQVAPHDDEGLAREGLVEEGGQPQGDRVVPFVGVAVGVLVRLLDRMAGAVRIDHHGLDAGAQHVALLRQPLQHARLVGRPQHLARRLQAAAVERAELVLDLTRVGGDDRPFSRLQHANPHLGLAARRGRPLGDVFVGHRSIPLASPLPVVPLASGTLGRRPGCGDRRRQRRCGSAATARAGRSA
jgi:hypothetical protein